MKVYISLPITGKPLKEIKNRALDAKTVLSLNGWEVKSPFDICPAPGMPYSYYMGEDIKALLECDAIYLMKGWEESRGCRAELEVAKIYEKRLMFEQ